MSKFTTPVSMQVTQEQYEKDLKESLKKLGYETEEWDNSSSNLTILVNNLHDKMGVVRNAYKDRKRKTYIENYNPTLFLAITAMTDEKDGIAGEYWVCTLGDSDFNTGELYKATKPINGIGAFIDKHGRSNGRFDRNHNHFRKATKEELINHFTKENVFSTNKTDMKKDTIIGYKLTKPEYEEAVGDIIKSQVLGYIKERDLSIKSNHHSIKLLEKAGVLSLWFTPIYKQQEQIFKVGNFEVKVKDGKVFHKSDDITEFTIGLINHFKPQTFGKYMMTVEDVIFSKTGCQTTSKLSEWLEVFKALNK